MQDKSELRKKQKDILKNLSNKRERDERIVSLLLSLDIVKESDVLLLYYPLLDEVDITPLFSLNKTIGFPVCDKDGGMEFYHKSDSFKKGVCFNKEPLNSSLVDYDKAVIIVPSLALCEDGSRLGRGKGYYDRYLSINRDRLYSIGLGYKESLVESVYSESHDSVLDLLIIDERVIERDELLEF